MKQTDIGTIMARAKTPALSLREYIAYRRAQLEFENGEIAAAGISMIGGGQMISRGERQRVIMILLAELESLAAWLEAGEPGYVPPLSEADKTHWRWVKDHGMDIPAHIEEQL